MAKIDIKVNNMKSNEYATKDLYFAAFLEVKGIKLLRLEQVHKESRKQFEPYYFIFEKKQECERLEQIFWGRGDPLGEYSRTVKDLRDRLFSIKRPRKERQNEDY